MAKSKGDTLTLVNCSSCRSGGKYVNHEWIPCTVCRGSGQVWVRK